MQASKQSKGRFPAVVIAGFQKCGTSALYNMLCAHPEISGAKRWDPSMRGWPPKELHFFDVPENFAKGAKWYASHFDSSQKYPIEATPEYISKRIYIKRMAKLIPDLRVVLLMRNPCERAYSAWNHWCQLPPEQRWSLPKEKGSLMDNLVAEIVELRSQMQYYGLVGRGCYIDQIEWLDEYYPSNQTLLCFSEDLRSNHEKEMKRVLGFLGVEASDIGQRIIHSREYKEKSIEPDVRRLLEGVYEPYNRRLEERCGRSLPW